MKKSLAITLMALSLVLTGCSNSQVDEAVSTTEDLFSDFIGDSINVSTVRDGSLQSCPYATVGDMADAFLANPTWRDFESTSGNTVVELEGGMTYDGIPTDALIQFELSGLSFQAVYLSLSGIDQNKLVLSALLTKMCDAV